MLALKLAATTPTAFAISRYLSRSMMAPTTRRSAASANNSSSNSSSSSQAKLHTSFKPSKVTKPKGKKAFSKTATPSNAKLIALPSEAATKSNDIPPRPASPTATNVPLAVPPEAAVASYQPNGETLAGAPKPSSSTSSILEEAKTHLLAQAPELAPLIAQHECAMFTPEGLSEVVDPFQSLASGVISQQVSGAAASSIKAKFVSLFSGELGELTFPTPAMVLRVDQPTLRSAGLSQRKAEYLHSLAEAFESGDISPEFFATATDQEIITSLTKIRGIGGQ
jgi:DNA-3-methyladenine glycosylase II